jgi:hypothetical protein
MKKQVVIFIEYVDAVDDNNSLEKILDENECTWDYRIFDIKERKAGFTRHYTRNGYAVDCLDEDIVAIKIKCPHIKIVDKKASEINIDDICRDFTEYFNYNFL